MNTKLCTTSQIKAQSPEGMEAREAMQKCLVVNPPSNSQIETLTKTPCNCQIERWTSKKQEPKLPDQTTTASRPGHKFSFTPTCPSPKTKKTTTSTFQRPTGPLQRRSMKDSVTKSQNRSYPPTRCSPGQCRHRRVPCVPGWSNQWHCPCASDWQCLERAVRGGLS